MADLTDWDDDISGTDEMDEDIIELTDIVDEGIDNTVDDEQVIELTDIIEEESHDLNLDIVKEEIGESEEAFDLEDESLIDDELEIEIDDPGVDESLPEDKHETDLPPGFDLSPEMLETALERVVEKKFADKIETILFEVMEKVIEKEIKEIKDSFQRNLDQIGND